MKYIRLKLIKGLQTEYQFYFDGIFIEVHKYTGGANDYENYIDIKQARYSDNFKLFHSSCTPYRLFLHNIIDITEVIND